MKKIKAGLVGAVLVLILIACDTKANRIEAEKAYIAAVDAYEAEQLTDSLILVRRAVKLDRKFYQASLLEGKVLFFSNKLEEAEKIFSKLVSQHPAYTEARIWHIRCVILKDDFKTAQNMLNKELSYNQTDWRIYSLYSLLARKTDNYEERLVMNRRAENILTGSAGVYLDMAIIWRTLGLDDRAQIYLEKAQQISGSNVSFQEMERAINQALWE
jgi:tetratricopeptide (TPR) repeat protein